MTLIYRTMQTHKHENKLNKPSFDIEISEYKQISEIEGAWTADDFRKLLKEMEFSADVGVSDEDLRELCLMSLADCEPDEAAATVLKYRLSDKMNAGQIQNAAQEFSEEKLWEEYADISLHESLFSVGSLLYAAFPQKFYTPNAVQITLEIKATNPAASEILATPLHESLLVRILADGMKDSAVLHRLFDDQLAGNHFPESNSIVWIVTPIENRSDNSASKVIQIISSCHWLAALENVDSYKSTATPDV